MGVLLPAMAFDFLNEFLRNAGALLNDESLADWCNSVGGAYVEIPLLHEEPA